MVELPAQIADVPEIVGVVTVLTDTVIPVLAADVQPVDVFLILNE